MPGAFLLNTTWITVLPRQDVLKVIPLPTNERRSKRSILKEGSPECSLEGLMLKLKLQYFGHLITKS